MAPETTYQSSLTEILDTIIDGATQVEKPFGLEMESGGRIKAEMRLAVSYALEKAKELVWRKGAEIGLEMRDVAFILSNIRKSLLRFLSEKRQSALLQGESEIEDIEQYVDILKNEIVIAVDSLLIYAGGIFWNHTLQPLENPRQEEWGWSRWVEKEQPTMAAL